MSTTAIIAVTAAPRTLAETVDHEALAYRGWGTPEGNFLARQMERLAQLIRLTEAETPGEFEDRLEVYECDEPGDHPRVCSFVSGSTSCLGRLPNATKPW